MVEKLWNACSDLFVLNVCALSLTGNAIPWWISLGMFDVCGSFTASPFLDISPAQSCHSDQITHFVVRAQNAKQSQPGHNFGADHDCCISCTSAISTGDELVCPTGGTFEIKGSQYSFNASAASASCVPYGADTTESTGGYLMCVLNVQSE